jgi:ketosteroid isomerase-like protein
MDPKQANELIERYWRAANAQDFDDLREIFADDVAVEWPQSGEKFLGKEACINVFANYPGGSPRFLGLSRVMGAGDVWVAEAEMMYPGDKKYMVVGIFQVRDGKIVHEIDYYAEPFPAPEWRKQWLPAE